MITSLRISVIVVLAVLSTFADSRSRETLIVKIFNPDNRPSDKQLGAMIKKADLESQGYKKELTTSLVSEPGSDKPLYQKKYLYYKIVDCSRVREIIQELETLLPDAYNTELITKINREITARNLTSMKQCKVGLEVHFKDGVGCTDKNSDTQRRKRRKRAPCLICFGSCSSIEATY